MIDLGAIGNLVTGVLDRVWPNPTEAERTKLEALKVAMSSELAVHATNQEEARHPSVFVAGWRPAVGWISAAGLAYAFLGQPLLAWLSLVADVPAPPQLDVAHLLGLLGGMLGFGAYRTYEGARGAKRSTWPTREERLP